MTRGSIIMRKRCGCPEQYKGRWCPACCGTGLIPPVSHVPISLLPDDKEPRCDGRHSPEEAAATFSDPAAPHEQR